MPETSDKNRSDARKMSEDDDHAMIPFNSVPSSARTTDVESPPGDSVTVQFRDRIAAVGPLGLLGFGLTTILLSFHNVGLYENSSMILGMARFYGGLAQFVAGVFELIKGATFAGTAFVSYACFWWSLSAIWTSESGAEPKAIGVYLMFWCIFTACMFVATLKKNLCLKLVFGTLTVTFFFLALGDLIEQKTVTKVGGAVGLLCGAIAAYTGLAEIIEINTGWLHGFH
jgi:succinate-acetate transporter protein